jgi:hemerythrin superfamily protein
LLSVDTGNSSPDIRPEGGSMDAITLLRDDHDNVRKLFTRFEQTGENAHKEKQEIVAKIIEELTVHAFIEEELFYPTVKGLQPQGGEEPEELVKEAEEEHAQVKTLLADLEGMTPQDEYFDAKVTVVIDNVRHHAEEEEEEMFPKVREAMGRNELQELGRQMLEAKERAPKLPSQADAAA